MVRIFYSIVSTAHQASIVLKQTLFLNSKIKIVMKTPARVNNKCAYFLHNFISTTKSGDPLQENFKTHFPDPKNIWPEPYWELYMIALKHKNRPQPAILLQDKRLPSSIFTHAYLALNPF